MSLVWWCKNCDRQEPAEDNGDDDDPRQGDSEDCPDCGSISRVYDDKDIPEIRAEMEAEEEDG